MTPRAASAVEIAIIRACILIAQEKGEQTARGDDGEDCWGKSEYEDSGLRIDSTLFFYKPAVGFFSLRVEVHGLLAFAASGCVDIVSVSAVQVFAHIPGVWEDKVFGR